MSAPLHFKGCKSHFFFSAQCSCHVRFLCPIWQGSYSYSQSADSSPPASVCVESSLQGLQMELSETCALCLSRLFSVLKLGQAPNSLTPAPSTTQESASCLPLVLKLQLNLQDVNMFTLSNVAGKYSWTASCFTTAFFLFFFNHPL